MARTITIDTGDELRNFIDELVKSGHYKTTSEVVREGLRLLQEKQAESKLKILQNLIQEGEESGDSIEWRKQEFLNRMDANINDKYEVKDNYDFDGAIRGRFYKPKKVPTTLRLDNDIILYFKKLASEQKVPYQTLINAYLRKELNSIEGDVKEA